jgi:hypothetical protein
MFGRDATLQNHTYQVKDSQNWAAQNRCAKRVATPEVPQLFAIGPETALIAEIDTYTTQAG